MILPSLNIPFISGVYTFIQKIKKTSSIPKHSFTRLLKPSQRFTDSHISRWQ